VAKNLLNRIFGFELLMAPYAVAHLKLGMQLQETGYKFESDQRLGIYLTNTLEEAAKKSEQLFAGWVADEANAAAKIKRDDPILVILGNPPYSNFGQMNRGKWILSLLDDYKRDLNEKKLNLDDDFIKFIRFAQWRIERTGEGIIGLITNNTYLDGITHRRMRESLFETFNEIYILDLHGSTKKKEIAPDGTKDESVFDITIGTSIAIFVKLPKTKGCRVFHNELWGNRETKYQILWEAEPATSQWKEIQPLPQYFFFVPKEFSGEGEYKNSLTIGECFPQHNAGIQTKRDRLVYHFSEQELQLTLNDVRTLPNETLTEKYDLPPDGRDWTINWAKKDVNAKNGQIIRVTYHPFDRRFTYYTGKTKGFMAYPRAPLMINALKDNLLVLCIRNARRGNIDSFFIANSAVDKDSVSPYDNVTFFPLYIYPATDELESACGRHPNFSLTFLKALAEKLKLPQVEPHGLPKGVTPEDIFHYAYAVFHSPTYRTRYAEFLKIDFPRLPLTSDIKLFRKLAAKGEELVGLHLMESPALSNFITEFPEKGDNTVEKVRYTDNDRRVWINPKQYFQNVPKECWDFQIGGYQVCEKWLKDRKGRKLGYEDIEHYQKIVVALKETSRLMKEIDECIPGWPIE
jgi:predicted helicase